MTSTTALAARMDPGGFDHDTCVCGLAIIRYKINRDLGWYHATGERGCRAALFEVDKCKYSEIV